MSGAVPDENDRARAGLPLDVDDLEPVPVDDDEVGADDRFRPCTDLGNAERLVARHGRDLRWAHGLDSWLRWSTTLGVWAVDDEQGARRWAQEGARAIRGEAIEAEGLARQAESDGEDERAEMLTARAKKLHLWTETSESTSRIGGALKEAQCLPGVPVAVEALDSHPGLLVVGGNATVELVGLDGHPDGYVRESRREELCTKRTPIAWTGASDAADCPQWLAFVDWAMGGDQALVSYLQRAVGYSLTGDVTEHAFFFCHGALGRNGKGTFLRVLSALLGPLCVTMAPGLLFESPMGGDRHPAELARLRGARLAIGNEVKPGIRWDEAKLKTLTGGDVISARGMGENFYDVKPTWKLWLAAQDKPQATASDQGLWDRMHLIPWLQTASGREDKHLGERLEAELSGILGWAVQGCRDWRANGLAPPPAVIEASKQYRAESDTIGEFISDCCTVVPPDPPGSTIEDYMARVWVPDAHVAFGVLYQAYQAWSKANGQHPWGANRFSADLGKRGFDRFVPPRTWGADRPRSVRGLLLRAAYAHTPANNRQPERDS